ncbi:hypothetical protein GCM10027425_27270 [Alteromonas gracilis]
MALGARLAFGTSSQRRRSMTLLAACVVGTAFFLTTWGLAVDQLDDSTAFSRATIVYLMAGTVLMVALPVLALLTTVARLSAAMRDRRLANLRLLGLSASRTRVVAATEVGLVSLVGTAAGGVLHLVAATLLPVATTAPPLAWPVSCLVVPALVVGVSLVPQRATALERSRRSLPAPPAWWRVLPLTAGLALCLWTQVRIDQGAGEVGQAGVLASLFGGVALVGLGVLIVVPVFTQLIASVVLRLGHGPRAILLGRRLQDQPAAMTRVVATLMVGLFVVMMARAVLSAFLTTPQYLDAAEHVEREQVAELEVPRSDLGSARARLNSLNLDEVRELPVLAARWGDYDADGWGATVVVARCADLRRAGRPLDGCRDDRLNLVGGQWSSDRVAPRSVSLHVWRDGEVVGAGRDVEVDFAAAAVSPTSFDDAVGALELTNAAVVSPDLPGVRSLAARSGVLLVVHAGPGDDLYSDLDDVGLHPSTLVDIENYRFVQGVEHLVWAVAVAVLSLGLLAFAVAAVDRATSRRRELASLRLIGTPVALLRWTQWLEAALPTTLGSLLALACGAYAGATYVQLDESITFPVRESLLLTGTALLLSLALAAVTVVGTSSRLDPEHIRVQ